MDVKNWHRRGKLPEPVQQLSYGPVWEEKQFPAKVRRELTPYLSLAGSGPKQKSTTTQRNGTPRKTTTAAKKSRTSRTRAAQPAKRASARR